MKFDKLQKEQRAALLKWISEDLSLKEMRGRAMTFKPPFKVTRQQINYYSRSRGLNAEKSIAQVFAKARALGFAVEKSVTICNAGASESPPKTWTELDARALESPTK